MSSLAVGNWTEENVFVTAYVASACVLCVTGLVGNAALLVILLVSKRSSSMNCLLVALTIIDTVYLSASLAVVFLYDMDYLYDLPIRYSLSGVMSAWIILYVIRWSQLAGIWITVQISVRFFQFPPFLLNRVSQCCHLLRFQVCVPSAVR